MNYSKLANISIIFIASVLFFLILKEFADFLRPFFIALILSFLFIPITRISKEKKRLVILNSSITILVLFITVSIIGTLFIDDSQKIDNINSSKNPFNYSSILNNEIKLGNINIKPSDYFDPTKFTSFTTSTIKNLFFSATDLFKELFLIFLFLMFILPSFDIMKNRIEERLNKNEKEKFRKSINEIEKSIRTYLSVKSLISLGTALVSGIIMYFFNVEFLFMFMVMIFVLNFIPNIGSLIAVVVIILSYLILNGFGLSLILLSILLILTQIIFGSILEPKIAGKELELSPIIILLSLFFWGYIWGIGGMLFAVPLISIIKIILSNIESTKDFVIFLS